MRSCSWCGHPLAPNGTMCSNCGHVESKVKTKVVPFARKALMGGSIAGNVLALLLVVALFTGVLDLPIPAGDAEETLDDGPHEADQPTDGQPLDAPEQDDAAAARASPDGDAGGNDEAQPAVHDGSEGAVRADTIPAASGGSGEAEPPASSAMVRAVRAASVGFRLPGEVVTYEAVVALPPAHSDGFVVAWEVDGQVVASTRVPGGTGVTSLSTVQEIELPRELGKHVVVAKASGADTGRAVEERVVDRRIIRASLEGDAVSGSPYVLVAIVESAQGVAANDDIAFWVDGAFYQSSSVDAPPGLASARVVGPNLPAGRHMVKAVLASNQAESPVSEFVIK